VILNAKSTLFYPASFAADSREVKLTGEAFFNVAKEKERPFIIKTEHANLKVLGTKFNVRAYPDDATMETSLIEGSLEVRENESNHPIILHPSEKAVITNRNTSSSITRKKTTKLTLSSISYFTPKDSVAIETTWLANKMVFKNTSFDELSKVLERKYDVQFIFGSKRASKLRLTANFGQEGLEQILLALKIAAPFNYKREDNRIIITD
jgi:ferric-dicitrate binding protein FerR (iron transport regulator)